jgi:Holliday junction resolvasome RuvABC endonuclease subunit
MSLMKLLSDVKPCRIIALDPASHSLAWSIFDLSKDKIFVVDTGKIDFSKQKEMSEKLAIINTELSSICDQFNPDRAVIEQSVYIQNFQSSRIISYIIGFSWGVLIRSCEEVVDVNPLVWKNKIGYKNVGKKEKDSFIKEFGEKNLQKRLKDERKNRVRVIVESRLGVFSDDPDINDSLGIGLWYALDRGY